MVAEPPKKRGPGRPTLIDTPAAGDPQGRTVREVILAYVRVGVPFSDACLLAGVAVNTAREWKARGEGLDKDRPATDWFATFAMQVESARAESRARAVASIREAFQGIPERTTVTTRKPIRIGDEIQYVEEVRVTEGRKVYWQAGAWLLERTATDQFGRARVWKDLVPVGDVPGEPPSTEELDAALDSAWAAYFKGRADQAAEGSPVEDPGANGAK